MTGKAASDMPALKPYRGKPAVRNFRGGNGNVGIIRSPVRAIALPDSRGCRSHLPNLAPLSGHFVAVQISLYSVAKPLAENLRTNAR